jgi:hypothetical protein
MSTIKRARPSPALVISVVAMFAALGGGAFAATATQSKKAVDNKGNLAKNVVKKKNIAKNAVVKSKIKNSAVTEKKLKGESVTSSKLGEGSVKAAQVGSITEVSSSPTTVLDGTIGSATVSCPADTKVVGGGYDTNSNLVVNIGLETESRRTDNGWRASIASFEGPSQLTAYAYCLEANG